MTDKNTAMNGDSLNISEQRKKELKQLFPAAFTETLNDAGELVHTVDFERLKAELGSFSEIYDNRRERYGMDWPGKRDCLRLIQQPSQATLKPCKEESVDFENTENLFIEGDNLEVLKLLQKSYYGQVKMIYIDPPYNTGKEFIYPDNFAESLDTYLEYAGLKEADGEGRKWSTNTQNEGRFHTKWLNMMYPRLYLARNLLRDDGVIFISIDDNEVENLRRMCDEIFGEENFLSCVIWHKKYAASNDTKGIAMMHDYLLVYQKSDKFSRNLLPRTDKQNALYKYNDDDGRGPWRPDNLSVKTISDSYLFSIKNKKTGKAYLPPKGRSWLTNEEKIQKWINEGKIFFGKNGDGAPQLKRYLSEVQQGIVPQSYWSYEEVGHTDLARKQLKATFDGETPFDNPKPLGLIQRAIQISCNENDMIMDFFAGSSTTAHACIDLNASSGKNIKFILVQLPEKTKLDPYTSISQISIERIRRAGQKIISELDKQSDNENNQNLDLGFKVLKLDQSNFKQWQAPAKDVSDDDLMQQLELTIDPTEPEASEDEMLYELLLKNGMLLTEKIEQIDLAGQSVFSIAEGELLIYLGEQINQDCIDAVLQRAPSRFICLDKAFAGNDPLKANAAKTFALFNQGKESIDHIDFKTV